MFKQVENIICPLKLPLIFFTFFIISFTMETHAAGAEPIAKLTMEQSFEGRFDEHSEVKSDDIDRPRMAIFQLVINPNETLTIDADSYDFNTRLRILDAAGKVLMEDDDSGIGNNARLAIAAKQFDDAVAKDLRLELTSHGNWDIGSYKISMAVGERPATQSKEKIEADIAYCQQALTRAETNNNEHRKGWVLAAMAWNHSLLGQYDQLREESLIAQKIAEKIGDKNLLATALKNIGAAAWYQGHADDAIPYFEKALNLRRECGDRKGEANSLDNLGIAYQQKNAPEQAIAYFEQALKICRELGDQHGEGNELGNLGIAYYTKGGNNQAIQYYEQALQIRRQIGDRRGEAYDLGNLGVVYAKLGEYQRAIVYYELAIQIRRELGDRRGEGRELVNLAKACVFIGEVQRAVEYKKESDRIQQEINSAQ
jgi:tetratricopeptide (TPR) repeat protein